MGSSPNHGNSSAIEAVAKVAAHVGALEVSLPALSATVSSLSDTISAFSKRASSLTEGVLGNQDALVNFKTEYTIAISGLQKQITDATSLLEHNISIINEIGASLTGISKNIEERLSVLETAVAALTAAALTKKSIKAGLIEKRATP